MGEDFTRKYFTRKNWDEIPLLDYVDFKLNLEVFYLVILKHLVF